MKKFLSIFTILFFTVNSVSAELSDTYTGASDDLARFKIIKENTKSPDDFSDSIATLAQEISAKIEAAIPAGDGRRENFEKIKGYVNQEISLKTLTLNRLNFMTLQFAIAMNPGVSSKYEIFEGVDLLIQNGIWSMPYDQAFAVTNGFIGQQEAMGTMPKDDIKELKDYTLTLFRPCDRGLWVFPLVNDDPEYGIKTYLDGFVDGITMVGLPVCSANCKIHEGLIAAGDYAYFLVHDLLHLQSLANSRNAEKNNKHVNAMRRVAGQLMNVTDANRDQNEQEKGYGILFWLTHELVNYIDLSDEGVAFDNTETLEDIFKGMIKHSKSYLDYVINPALADENAYYHRYLTLKAQEEDAHFLKNKTFDMYGRIFNETAVVERYDSTGNGDWVDIKNQFVVTVKDRASGELSAHVANIFYSRPTQLAFAYSQVELMKVMGDIGDGNGTYGATLATFNPSVANGMMHSILDDYVAIVDEHFNPKDAELTFAPEASREKPYYIAIGGKKGWYYGPMKIDIEKLGTGVHDVQATTSGKNRREVLVINDTYVNGALKIDNKGEDIRISKMKTGDIRLKATAEDGTVLYDGLVYGMRYEFPAPYGKINFEISPKVANDNDPLSFTYAHNPSS